MSRQFWLPGLLRQVAPALTLGLLAPLVAEYLLGDLRITDLTALPVLILVYGAGAVLIREVMQRRAQSRTVFLTLAVAYAILAEGIVDQSFFNPDFMHQNLLAYGFWPWLGTAPVWVICVITLHVVWSLAVPIGMTESLFPERSTEPWLGQVGLAVGIVLFLLGNLALASFFYRTATHRASAAQITVCSVLILGLLVLALTRRRAQPKLSRLHTSGAPVWLGVVGFLAGSLFVGLYSIGASVLHWSGNVTAAAELGLNALGLVLLVQRWSNPWSMLELWWASTGGLLVYAWHGYQVDRALHGAGGFAGHTVIVLGLCAVQAAAWFRIDHTQIHKTAGANPQQTYGS